jgi:N-acetylmuramic acid 6-phosphate etherase
MIDFKITEEESLHKNLDQLSVLEILEQINSEDKKVAEAVEQCIPMIHQLVEHLIPKMKIGGRLFYIGSGTSGRLGIVDASECPPTFGVSDNVVIGIIAGGDHAIRKAVEYAEDNRAQAWLDLKSYSINELDTVIGIAASGSTPYVLGGLEVCRENNISTGCITCNPQSPITFFADFPVVCIVGPEFLTGSTRMKSGTAQKLILNMISTSIMIKLGKVKGNQMVDMRISNKKLFERGVRMIQQSLNVNEDDAKSLLEKYGNVRTAIESNK